MSKKSKKTQPNAQVQEPTNQTAEEREMEAVQAEEVPATIVESGEAEVFAGQEIQTEAPAEETQPEAKSEQSAQPAPAEKKPRGSKRPYISLVEAHLTTGDFGKKELLAEILKKFPDVTKGGVQTFLTDLMNSKYRHWKDRAVVKTPEGKLMFEDMVPSVNAPAEAEVRAPEDRSEVQSIDGPIDEQTEQPGE